jgi:uncharacterized protein YfaS (alpha-2-macroglobulin family)
LLVEVTDVNQQTLSHRVEFVRHSSDFYLGLCQGADVLKAGTALPLEVVALGTDGKPWPEPVKAHLSLQKVDWQSVRIQGAGRTTRFRNEAVFTNVLEKEICVEPVTRPETQDEAAHGNRLADLPTLTAGQYLVEVKAEDSAGKPVVTSLNFQVTAPGEAAWDARNDVQITLKPDHSSYSPGDTANILVEAPFSGTALVTVEREKVLRSFVTQLEGNAPSVQVPLGSADIPNVFVSVTLVRGSDNSPHKSKEPEYRMGYCQLPVTDSRSRLAVEITSAETNCLPGAPLEVTVQVSDSAHCPVSGAQVVLYAVDDGILGLTEYALPDPYKFFYAPRGLRVQSSVSLPNLLTENPEELQFGNKGFLGGGGGKEPVRKNFLACAFWNSTLSTDADGQAHVRFVTPDSLTRYRLFAVAHTTESQFGCGQSAFRITKPLVIEPSLPAFANITDHLIARGIVFNQTTKAGEIIVTLELDCKARASGTNQALARCIEIPALGSAPVEFPVEFTDAGEAKWLWRAHFADAAAGNFTDAVESKIAVGHIAPFMREVLFARVATDQTNLLARANPQLLGGRGTITVTVASTRLSELGEAASQLLHYPYGCAEQTGSSLLPWVVLRDAPCLLPASRPNTDDAASAIQAGVARLFSMQTESGGLGYWPHAKEPMLWASAYGGMVLALAQRHGIALPRQEFDSLLNYLSQQLRSSGHDASLSEHCLGLYALALAGRAEPAYHERLYTLRGRLLDEDRALLALAVAEAHGPHKMFVELLNSSSAPHPADERVFGCAAREVSIRLLAWLNCQPDASVIDALVSNLMREQRAAHWGTTQANAWALLALTEYARRIETRLEPAEATLRFAGQSIPFRLDEKTTAVTHTFSIANFAEATLLLSKVSPNRLYTTVSIEARLPETAQPRQDRGFSLQRCYDRLDNDNQPQGTASWHVGDRVVVTLRLGVHDQARYVVIDDALPSILEAVNPEFRTQEVRSADRLTGSARWWLSDFREIRKDRCVSFADWVSPGNYAFRYLARVRAAGSVTAPAAKAEEMYQPERYGLTETQTLVSEAGD